ncbi:MAG TPA: response regulator [Caulobacteraceae bacterium]|nr:response regulator [Caulobacteraceae bacterium]
MVDLKDIRVLVVDDHENMRRILAALLRAFGFHEIRECADGAQALAAVPVFRPDIIVTDFAMPHLDGISFAGEVRAMKDVGLAHAPILMVTGHAHMKQVMAARDAGVNEFLAKPVNGRTLAERITRMIQHERASAQGNVS